MGVYIECILYTYTYTHMPLCIYCMYISVRYLCIYTRIHILLRVVIYLTSHVCVRIYIIHTRMYVINIYLGSNAYEMYIYIRIHVICTWRIYTCVFIRCAQHSNLTNGGYLRCWKRTFSGPFTALTSQPRKMKKMLILCSLCPSSQVHTYTHVCVYIYTYT